MDAIPAVEVLKGLRVRRTEDGLVMIFDWRSGQGGINENVIEGIFFLAGLAFFIFPLIGLIDAFSSATLISSAQLISTVPFLLLGFFIIYRACGNWFNHSRFEVTSQKLKLRNGPLIFLGANNLTLERSQIVTVEWEQIGHSSRRDRKDGYTATFDVQIVTLGDEKKKIVVGLKNPEYAYAIQGELSRFLKIGGG